MKTVEAGDQAILIRAELPGEELAIARVHESAFESDAEARLVGRLRAENLLAISLVALLGGDVVGHIAMSRVSVDGSCEGQGLGLAPVAIEPVHQNRGYGSEVIRNALKTARRKHFRFAVVLGDPAFYRRFGFVAASHHNISNDYGVDAEFMIRSLDCRGIPESGGHVRYASPFADL